MAFSAFRGTTSPRDEPTYPNYPTNPLSPPRNSNRLSGGIMSSNAESRVGLQRRFTTNALPTLSPIGQQRLQAAGDVKQVSGQEIYAGVRQEERDADMLKQPNRYSALPPSEQKSRFYESLLAEQRRIQQYIEQIDPETRREVDENLRHEHAVSQMIAQSEPTTPPDYGDAFPSAFSKPNRYSLTSASNSMMTRPNRASTQFTSPPMALSRLYNANASVPGSRRHSDDEEDMDDFMPSYDTSTTSNPNRNSLPVTRHDRQQANVPDLQSVFKRTSITSKSIHTSPQDNKTYLQVQHTADGFPKLIRREENGIPTESGAGLDTTLPKQETQPTTARNRISLPPTALRTNDANIAGISGVLNSSDKAITNNRHSIEVRPSLRTTPPRSLANGNMPAPYSTNDVPTLKSVGSVTSPSKPTTETASSLTRVNSGPHHMSQHSQDFTQDIDNGISTPASSLHASAIPFTGSTPSDIATDITSPMHHYGPQAYYAGYGMPLLNNGFANMNLNGPAHAPWPQQYQQNMYNNFSGYTNGQANGGAPRFNDARVNGRARNTDEGNIAQINGIRPTELKGQVFELCIDQHGCRFLQRKLDDRDPVTTNIIFEEVRPQIYQLMIDPFGNYLCQKLLEYCTDAQRTDLIKGTTARMAEIALNQHGTRALQKMIEFIVTPEQTELIIEALRYKVVMLIQDLNGNHVIQKCLNHLKSADAQFIFDAVGSNCITVGTHRHGCCVLQRCIDHATGIQKGTLVAQITNHAMTLIQDPFGNYVIQYILDIAEPAFTEPLCKAFLGNIALLSTQKFSSNVIEKCIRCAGPETKNQIVLEISSPSQLEGMLRDSYANYVVQTALDSASEDVKPKLVNNIRPLLAAVRHTPYGRRIQSKITEYDNQIAGAPSSVERLNAGMTPGSPQGILAQYNAYGPTNGRRQGFVGAPPAWSLNATTSAVNTNGMTANIPINGYAPMTDYNGPNYNTSRQSQANYRFF